MSLSAYEYSIKRRNEEKFFHKLGPLRQLSENSLLWMNLHNKFYSQETIENFEIQEATLSRFQKDGTYSPSGGPRGFIGNLKCIVIPVGPIFRCYAYELDKKERWHVTPAGYGAQWIGPTHLADVLSCEGEWDCFRLHDRGFNHAITHTAGAGTFLEDWIPKFSGKRITLLYDVDEKGKEGAAKAAFKLHKVTAECRIAKLPLRGTPDENDVSDFFRIGGTAEELQKIIKEARSYARPIFYSKRDRAVLRHRRNKLHR